MLQIDRQLISLDVIEQYFACDLAACKGACCVEGDSGAPLTEEEAGILEEIYPTIEPYLTPTGIQAIKEQGKYIIDTDEDLVTPLVNNLECAYTVFENGIAFCGIEKAWFDKKIDFRKPVSCHLYPVRITSYTDFDAVNYDRQKICDAARKCGKKLKIPLYIFLKDVLIRKFGSDWYQQLEIAVEMLKQQK